MTLLDGEDPFGHAAVSDRGVQRATFLIFTQTNAPNNITKT